MKGIIARSDIREWLDCDPFAVQCNVLDYGIAKAVEMEYQMMEESGGDFKELARDVSFDEIKAEIEILLEEMAAEEGTEKV